MPIVLNSFPLNWDSGDHIAGPANINNNVNNITVRLKRSTTATPQFWPNFNTELSVRWFVSYDNGATWLSRGGAIFNGGIQIDGKTQSERPEAVFGGPVDPGTGRRVRLEATVTNGPLNTEVTIETD